MVENSLDRLLESEQITGDLDQFLDEVMDLMEAVVIHLEKGEQVSPVAGRAFRNHRRVLDNEHAAGRAADGNSGAVDQAILSKLRESFNYHNSRRGILKGLLQSDAEELEKAGLVGADLELKTAGWRRAARWFLNDGTRKSLASVWRWANLLLGSASAAFPAFEAVKELKDVFHNLYKDVTA